MSAHLGRLQFLCSRHLFYNERLSQLLAQDSTVHSRFSEGGFGSKKFVVSRRQCSCDRSQKSFRHCPKRRHLGSPGLFAIESSLSHTYSGKGLHSPLLFVQVVCITFYPRYNDKVSNYKLKKCLFEQKTREKPAIESSSSVAN